jgi:hypothetical protein
VGTLPPPPGPTLAGGIPPDAPRAVLADGTVLAVDNEQLFRLAPDAREWQPAERPEPLQQVVATDAGALLVGDDALWHLENANAVPQMVLSIEDDLRGLGGEAVIVHKSQVWVLGDLLAGSRDGGRHWTVADREVRYGDRWQCTERCFLAAQDGALWNAAFVGENLKVDSLDALALDKDEGVFQQWIGIDGAPWLVGIADDGGDGDRIRHVISDDQGRQWHPLQLGEYISNAVGLSAGRLLLHTGDATLASTLRIVETAAETPQVRAWPLPATVVTLCRRHDGLIHVPMNGEHPDLEGRGPLTLFTTDEGRSWAVDTNAGEREDCDEDA